MCIYKFIIWVMEANCRMHERVKGCRCMMRNHHGAGLGIEWHGYVVATLGFATWFCVLVLGCMAILLFLVSLAAIGGFPLSINFDGNLVECLRLNSDA